jgi:hypothetical protein
MPENEKGRPTIYKNRAEVKFYTEETVKSKLEKKAADHKPPVSVSQLLNEILEKTL